MHVIARIAAFLLALLPMEEAASKSKQWSTVGLTIENTAWVDADPQAVWKAFVEDADKWWPDEEAWRGRGSAAQRAIVPLASRRWVSNLHVLSVEPGRLMRLRDDVGPLQGMGEQHGALEWCFAEENGGTRITLRYGTHDYLPDDISELATAVDEVQADRLRGLAQYLRSGGPAPGPKSVA